jgi:hypothetical protein
MTEISSQDSQLPDKLSEETIVDYLKQHPDFFFHHEDLLTVLKISHDSGTAVSLVERKLAVLRKENQQLQENNQQLQHQWEDLVSIAEQNAKLNQRIQQLVGALANATDIEEFFQTLYSTLCNEFNTDIVVIRWFELPHSPAAASRQEFIEYDAQVFTLFDRVLENRYPLCGQLVPEQTQFLFPDTPIASAVLLPLGEPKAQGLLAMGSQDAKRFHADMGTEFLQFMGTLISHLLKLWLRFS